MITHSHPNSNVSYDPVVVAEVAVAAQVEVAVDRVTQVSLVRITTEVHPSPTLPLATHM